MNKVWQEPQVMVQPFVANEYVAACGAENFSYMFKCDAGTDDNGDPIKHYDIIQGESTKYIWRVYKNDGTELTHVGLDTHLYGPCGTTHEADSKDEFLNGWMDDAYTTWKNEHIPVIIWTGPNNDNIHCTKNLNMSTWTTAKS